MEIDTNKDSEKENIYVTSISTRKILARDYKLFMSLTEYPLMELCLSIETATVSEPGRYSYEYEETLQEETRKLLAIRF